MNKFKNISLWLILVTYMVVALGFVSESHSKVVCGNLNIQIKGDDVNRFVRKQDVNRILEKYHQKVIGKPIDSINTYIAEELISKNSAVRSVAAYVTVDGSLNIKVEQRRPIMRVINNKLQSYYIDDLARVFPVYSNYAAFTMVANGHIKEPFDITISRDIYPSSKNKDTILRANIIYDLYQLASYIDKNDFWKTFIQQVYVSEKQDLILVPRVGSQNIILGDSKNLDEKFKKLKSMYRAFNVIGWDKYKTINLKYKDQVVCTKR